MSEGPNSDDGSSASVGLLSQAETQRAEECADYVERLDKLLKTRFKKTVKEVDGEEKTAKRKKVLRDEDLIDLGKYEDFGAV